MRPLWLPDEIVFNGGSVTQDYAKLYDVFCADLMGDPLQIEGADIIVDTGADHAFPQYERGFVHLVTRESGGTRLIDYDRAKKLCWIKPVVQNHTTPDVHAFWYTSATGEELYLWLHEHDYAVVLKPFKDLGSTESRILVTAFFVESWKKKQLAKKMTKASKVL